MGHCYLGFHMTYCCLLPCFPVSYLSALQLKGPNKGLFEVLWTAPGQCPLCAPLLPAIMWRVHQRW